MAFERWSAEFQDDFSSNLARPSDGRPVKTLVFIQCVGARDKRYLEYCSAVCCMHASKQAAWMKRRHPDLDVIVFYTDLRGPGKGQEAYIQTAKKLGVRFYRRRPGLVAPVEGALGKGIIVRHETETGVGTTLADIVILNGGLACSPQPETHAPLPVTPAGKQCGFCAEPTDIAHSVIQAGNVAALAFLRSRGDDGRAVPTTIIAGGESA
jgi:heterodisulfide reductase subunit A